MLETGKYHFKLVKNFLPAQIGSYFSTSATEVVSHTYNLRSRNSNRPPRCISKSKFEKLRFNSKVRKSGMPCHQKLKFVSLLPNLNILQKHMLETEFDSSIFLNETALLLST